jgi:hypothetical protein
VKAHPGLVPSNRGPRSLDVVDAQAQAETAVAKATVFPPSIQITTHLWITWGEVAIQSTHRAAAARARGQATQGDPGRTGLSEALGEETADAMVALCAAAFAVEAVISAVARIVIPTLAQKWETAGQLPKAIGRVREVLKNAISTQATANALADRWEPVLAARSAAVHFLETRATPEPHPLGTNTAPEHVRYRLESAEVATSLLLDTLRALRGDPKPAMSKWAKDFAAAVERLELS